MVEEVIYDVVSDVDYVFSPEFRDHVCDENLLCGYYDIQDRRNWLFRKDQQAHGVDSDALDLLHKLMALRRPIGWNCLIQFWKAEQVAGISRRFIFSTRNQPFLIEGTKYQVREKICSYRMKMADIARESGGVISRVFRKKRMEFSPNIGYYSNEEYPLRDLALSCRILNSLAIPLSDCNGRLVGVLEMVSTSSGNISLMSCLAQASRLGSSLKYLDYCKHLHGQYDPVDEVCRVALSEIDDVVQMVGVSCGLVGAQTWISCNYCGSLSISKSLAGNDCGSLSIGKSLAGMHHASYVNDFYLGDEFFEAEYVPTLEKGEGVVGKAASGSHNLVYCDDVSQFCITEYPLAHIVRHHGLTSCLAICLKSVLSGRHIYVLELFLYQSRVHGMGLTDTLISILEVMRRIFRTLKVASGGKIRSKGSSVQVIDFGYRDIYRTIEFSDLKEENVVLNIGDRDFSIVQHSQQRNSSKIFSNKAGGQLATGVTDAISLQEGLSTDRLARGHCESESNNNHARISNSEQASVVGDPPPVQVNVHPEENVMGSEEFGLFSSNLPERRDGISLFSSEAIDLNELLELSDMTGKEAAQSLNISLSALKSACRENNIPRWPPRERNIEHQFGPCSSAQTVSSEDGSDTTVQSDYLVIVNAEYGDIIIQFPLSSASGIDVLHQEVTNRLNLEAETYTIKFLDDENDFVSILCDEDLHEHIYRAISYEKTTLTLFIENVAPVLGSSHAPL